MPVVIMTAYGSIADAVTAMRDGACDFIQKPIDLEHLRLENPQWPPPGVSDPGLALPATDLVLCLFPMEPPIYARHGVGVELAFIKVTSRNICGVQSFVSKRL